jgi:hypothetical protein
MEQPPLRACLWCQQAVEVIRRPGRPRLYCRRSCRQRAYERRSVTAWLPPPARLPAPLPRRVPPGFQKLPGYERGTIGPMNGLAHAMRTAGLAQPHNRRPTLCGILARPARDWFRPADPDSCFTCAAVAAARPLDRPVEPSTDLAHLRAVLERVEVERQRGLEPEALDALLRRACRTADPKRPHPERTFAAVG